MFAMMWLRLFLAVCSALAVQAGQAVRHRELTLDSKRIGTVTLDFYNSFITKGNLLSGGKSDVKKFALPPLRIKTIVAGLNTIYAGRVKFEIGDIIEFGNSTFYKVPSDKSACGLISDFSQDPGLRKDRISIVTSTDLNSNSLTSCTGRSFIPLGQSDRAPALILFTGLRSLGGGGLAHGLGHILGYKHTSDDFTSGIETFTECGLNLTYPFFRIDKLFNTSFVAENGITYDLKDWKGRSNFMARFRFDGLTFIWAVVSAELGLYKFNYEPIFEDIARCWFNQSKANLALGPA